MTLQSLTLRIRRAIHSPELRRHPVRAVMRRIAWRRHWRKNPHTPIILERWWGGMRIELPNTSNASLIYYRRGGSDPVLAATLEKLVRPGMVVLDIGAHIGEYTLMAAKLAGPQGAVHAVEPLPPCAEVIRRNAAINGARHVFVHNGAITDKTGPVEFASDPGQTAGWMAASHQACAFRTEGWSLDDFVDRNGIRRVDFIKLDASGNELAALRGGKRLLSDSNSPTLVAKLYNRAIVRERFGYDINATIETLLGWNYQLTILRTQDRVPIAAASDVDACFDDLIYSRLLLAVKKVR